MKQHSIPKGLSKASAQTLCLAPIYFTLLIFLFSSMLYADEVEQEIEPLEKTPYLSEYIPKISLNYDNALNASVALGLAYFTSRNDKYHGPFTLGSYQGSYIEGRYGQNGKRIDVGYHHGFFIVANSIAYTYLIVDNDIGQFSANHYHGITANFMFLFCNINLGLFRSNTVHAKGLMGIGFGF
ncbi:MAG: hypothetical protein Q9M28_04930 [Mariprofundaceae bacterium]|nr:hypothetical protein [Mariprofundaceae bacterium]